MLPSKLEDFGFIILCPQRDIPGLRCTVRRIGYYYDTAPCLAVKPKGTTRSEIAEMKQICDVATGNITDLSLLNAGLKKSKKNWNFVLYESGMIRPRFHVRYDHFLQGEKDVLFPVLEGQMDFVTATMNGLLISKTAFEEVGPFEPNMDLILSKLIWAYKAESTGIQFKGIVGIRV